MHCATSVFLYLQGVPWMSVQQANPIYSTMSDDPDMADLLVEFVGNLSARVQAIENAVAASDLAELTRLAHQLKGAGGGYGFDVLGTSAASLEQASKAAGSVQEVTAGVAELVALCRRATAESKPPG